MSDQNIVINEKPEYQEVIGRINEHLEQLAKPPIGMTNDALDPTGQPGEPPIGRTNDALDPTSKPGAPPIGVTNDAKDNAK